MVNSPLAEVYTGINKVSSQWEDLPQANRQRLLWLLSHLLERQLQQSNAPDKEDGDERSKNAE